jgi:spermidine synthase
MVTLVEDGDLAISFREIGLVDSEVSAKATIQLWKHRDLGHILTIDGEVQHVEGWQALYHEPLVHLPSAFVPEIRDVLILGGGSLFAAAQVLLYPTLVSITLVDHDSTVLNLVERHYVHARLVRKDLRFSHVRDDIGRFLENSANQYDLVINDGFDLLVPGRRSIMRMHRMMTARLRPHGACADVIYRHAFDGVHRRETRVALEELGSYALSMVTVPEYPGVLHLLTVWGGAHISQGLRAPTNRVQKSWSKKQETALEYYDPKFIQFYLHIPPYLRRLWQTSSDERFAET